MQIGLHAVVMGARQQEKRLEVIANNLANAGTVGFKKEGVHFKDFIDEATYTQYGQGALRQTGQAFDVALRGKGFLRVQSEQGVLYTRAGNLTLNSNNTLVTPEGWPVLGRGGGPIQVSGRDVRIELDGQVFNRPDDEGAGAEYTVVDTLDVVEFGSEVALNRVGRGYFRPRDENQQPGPVTDVEVQQGAVEEANFNVVEEMARMIDTQRSYEAYYKTLQFFQQEDSQVISKLGNP